MAKITGIHIHDCTSITASFESSNGTSWLTIKYGDVLQNINIFMDPARAEMIANAINRAEDDYEKIAAEMRRLHSLLAGDRDEWMDNLETLSRKVLGHD
jgi:hypothetical protein